MNDFDDDDFRDVPVHPLVTIQRDVDNLRSWTAKLSVDFDEVKGHFYASTTIVLMLLGLILYKVW